MIVHSVSEKKKEKQIRLVCQVQDQGTTSLFAYVFFQIKDFVHFFKWQKPSRQWRLRWQKGPAYFLPCWVMYKPNYNTSFANGAA